MIRLAWHQGLLTQPDLNSYQRFAAIYHIHAMRRREVQDINETLEKQTWYQYPDRYDQLFTDNQLVINQPLSMVASDEEEEEGVNDIDEMDAYFADIDKQRAITGEQLFSYMGDEGGWV